MKKRQELKELQQKKIQEATPQNATRKEKIQAYRKLRQDPEMRSKTQKYKEDMLKAMEKEDPKTQEYMQKMREARKRKYQQKMGQKSKSNNQSAN